MSPFSVYHIFFSKTIYHLFFICQTLRDTFKVAESIAAFKELTKTVGFSSERLDGMSGICKKLGKENAILALSTYKVSEQDKKAILIKAGLITAEEADTAATTTDTVAKGANLGITELLTVAWAKLNAVIKANPFTAFLVVVTALGVEMGKIADRVYNAEKYAKKALDKTAEKVKEAKSEIESLNSELQTTQSRINELNTKENLSLVEREELERLKEANRELEREIRLKQSVLSEEQKDANRDAKKYFTTEKDSLNFESSYEGVEIHEKTDYIGTVEERIEKLQQHADGQIKLSEETIESYKDYVESAISDFMESDDYLIEGQDGGLLKRLDTLYEKFDIYTNGKASITEDRLKDILAKADFQSASKELEKLGKSGELSVNTLISRFPELIEYLDKTGISAEELYQYIMALSNPDAIRYDEVEKQFKETLGMRDGEINGASDQKIQDKIDSEFDSYERELVLDAYLMVRDQYGDHPEGWTADDWISNIQSELNNKGIEADVPLSFDQVWTNSFTSENETVRELGNSLLELAQKGRLTVDTFNTADSTRYFTSFGISADEAVAKINQLADKSNQLSSMSGQISKMSAALSAKKKNGFVDTDALSGFDTEVRSLESWNTFQETLGSTTSSYSECQEAANALATEWVNSSDFLNQLTEGNREYYETQLESMGIANAEEIVMQSLADAKANAFLASYDLANATDDEVIAMLNEAESAGITSDMIFKLVAEEQIFNAQGLSTEEKVAQLKKLADTYGQTAVAAKIARMEEEYTKSHQPINYEEIAKAASAEINNAINSVHVDFKGVGIGRKSSSGSGSSKPQTERDTTKEYNWIEQAIENVKKEIKTLDETASSSYSTLSQKNEALTNEIGKVTEEIELQQKAYEEYMRKADSIGLPDSYKDLVQNGAAGIEDIKDEKLQEQIDSYQKWYEKAQNASDAIRELNTGLKDLRVESYKLQTETLKDRLGSESITEKQYLTELKAAYEQFYGNLSEYAEQYHEAKLEYLKEEKNYLNSVANAAKSVLDTEIDRIREDAEKQEEQLKTQAELLEARKKPLQEELEALDEKTRKEELAFHLQKAQYDLARAENQQTKLVYTADKGMIYTSDSTAIRDARKGLDDAKSEIHKQSIQDQIDALDDEISRYDDLIDQINKAADAQVKALEQFKSKWQEVIDVQEQAKNITILTGEFGADAVAKILSGKDGDLLAQWKDSYLDTLKSIDLESQGYIGEMTKQVESFYQHSIKALSDAAGKAADAANAAAARNNLNLLDHPITLENGTVLTPLQPGGRGYDLLLKTKPLTDKIMRGEMDIFSNAVFEGQRQMEQWAKTINYSNIINHVANNVTNNRNTPPVINNYIDITCPGVTQQDVARYIGPALVRELNREFQGLHVYADQMSRDKTY